MPFVLSARTCRLGRLFVLLTLSLTCLVTLAPAVQAQPGNNAQWYLDAMQTEQMWESSSGEGITIAVLDTGVDKNVPELQGRVLEGRNFDDPDVSPYEDPGAHGTTMAAMISGTGRGGGIQGLAPRAKILPVTAIPQVGPSRNVGDAINYAVDQNVDIINMSFGAVKLVGEEKVQRAVDRAYENGILMFAGTGNLGSDTVYYPAALPGVVAVAASDKNARRVSTSQYGAHVALSAPGDKMAVRCKKNTAVCEEDGGTSGATALASASAALIWSKYPDWTANQVLRVLIETAAKPADGKVPSKYIGYGAVRPRIALADDTIDPGDPHKNPLFSKYYAEREKKGSDAEKPNENHEPQSSGEEKLPEETASTEDSDGAPTLGIFMGGAVAALGGVVGFFLFRRWRSSERH